MAKLIFFLAVQILLLAAVSSALDVEGESFAKTIDRKLLGLHKKEKLTHFKVYWQDILSGPNPTSIVIQPPVSNSSSFGAISMIDNALTAKIPTNSTVLGRAQGFYAGAAQNELGFLMAMNFVFTTGKYNGSTITILGRNTAMSEVREMPIVGGSGLFRFARGYAEARPKWFDVKTGDATVEYTCYVLHY